MQFFTNECYNVNETKIILCTKFCAYLLLRYRKRNRLCVISKKPLVHMSFRFFKMASRAGPSRKRIIADIRMKLLGEDYGNDLVLGGSDEDLSLESD